LSSAEAACEDRSYGACYCSNAIGGTGSIGPVPPPLGSAGSGAVDEESAALQSFEKDRRAGAHSRYRRQRGDCFRRRPGARGLTADHATRPDGSQEFFDKASSTDKTLKLYEGHFHDLLNDLGREEVMDDIIGWIDARVGQAAKAELAEAT
jgi:hypothetical protein